MEPPRLDCPVPHISHEGSGSERIKAYERHKDAFQTSLLLGLPHHVEHLDDSATNAGMKRLSKESRLECVGGVHVSAAPTTRSGRTRNIPNSEESIDGNSHDWDRIYDQILHCV